MTSAPLLTLRFRIVATLAVESGYTRDPSGGEWAWARLNL